MEQTDTALTQMGQLERVTLGERAYLKLRQLIMSGKLAPNEKLSLRSVAEALGVSIMPVREAVTRLVAEGALSLLPNRAISVPLMTRAKFEELLRIRTEIEGFAAAEAAVHRTSRDLKLILDYDKDFRDAVGKGDSEVDSSLQLNKELHFAVYEAAGSPILVSIIEGLWLKVGPVINLDLRASQRLASGNAETHHARLVEAIINQDGNAARAAVVADIRSSGEFILGSNQLWTNLPEPA
ncbi:GntR family transcriptional regulator [Aminobacter sp. AP02]|uniref:GntR family transcriptional regulator n=1 Tax=Aminobacter sp. AP02 TaxID=2135737 RepID=UPI000D7AB577|nr:GntR family transcriptional regulator [Aminobacter sp. AP02]PWK65660.1 GntR family transcriptional regulator [Aminobacter sp. AP02]